MGLNPLEQFNAVTIIGMIVIFWMTFVALKITFFNPLLEVVVTRREKIAAAKEKMVEAEEIVAGARHEAEAMLAEADEEVEKITRESAEEVEALRQEKVVVAKEDAERVLAEGRVRVAEVRRDEEDKVREELVGCTTIACNRLVGDVDRRLVSSVVDKVMRAKLAT